MAVDPSAAGYAERVREWAAHRDFAGLDDPRRCSAAARELSERGLLRLPPPGAGRTRERFDALSFLGSADLSLARLAEGHVDAVAILHELGRATPADGQLWGVWAADPPHQRLRARPAGNGWRLDGVKPWCSGASECSHALVTAFADDGYRLFVLDVDEQRAAGRAAAVEGSWPAFAMSGTDSASLSFTGAGAEAIGGPDAYLSRPGFWHGAVGVTAVWLGGAEGVAVALERAADAKPLNEHALAHAGAVDAALHAARVVLTAAADAIDADPGDHVGAGPVRAGRTRAVVERAATDVVDRVGRALGAAPLGADRAHGRRVADLTLYLRQSHAERDLADLGRRVCGARP